MDSVYVVFISYKIYFYLPELSLDPKIKFMPNFLMIILQIINNTIPLKMVVLFKKSIVRF